MDRQEIERVVRATLLEWQSIELKDADFAQLTDAVVVRLSLPDNTFDGLLKRILNILPNASMDEDSQGQLVIHTDLSIGSNDQLEEFVDFDR